MPPRIRGWMHAPACSESEGWNRRAANDWLSARQGLSLIHISLPPFEAPFQTPESPPVPRAEALCSLPACSNKSFAFGTGGRIHPSPYGGRHEVTTRGLPFVRTPARRRRNCQGCGHDLRNPKPSAGPYGGKGGRHDVRLGRDPARRAQGIIMGGME